MGEDGPYYDLAEQDAEITSLRAELAEAKTRIAELEIMNAFTISLNKQLQDAQQKSDARAEKAEAELDISREAHRMIQSALLSQAAETERAEAQLLAERSTAAYKDVRIERAEAERDALRELLDWIYGFLSYVDSYHSRMIRDKVRAALPPSSAREKP